MKQELVIKDKLRYQFYHISGKTYFDNMMYAALELIPKQNDKWPVEAMVFAEGFAFQATDAFLKVVDGMIDQKMYSFRLEITSLINQMSASMSSNSTE